MTRQNILAKTAFSFGCFAKTAVEHAKAGRTQDARWYAKHARADWRALCHTAGLPGPAAHRHADSFAA